MGAEIGIVHEPTAGEPFLIASKPSGLPSAPLKAGDDSALTQMLAFFPEIAAVRGRKAVECGLVHRLDTPTSGLLLAAASQDFYDRILAEQEAGRFIKSYEAGCDVAVLGGSRAGFPPPPAAAAALGGAGDCRYSFAVESRFRPWGPHGREVRPVVAGGGAAARKKASGDLYRTELSLSPLPEGSGLPPASCRAVCRIRRGYRHQVRCHLAWLGLPVRGDPLYNASFREGEPFCFRATGLEFLGLSFTAD